MLSFTRRRMLVRLVLVNGAALVGYAAVVALAYGVHVLQPISEWLGEGAAGTVASWVVVQAAAISAAFLMGRTLDKRLARTPLDACPSCGYDLGGTKPVRETIRQCPECAWVGPTGVR